MSGFRFLGGKAAGFRQIQIQSALCADTVSVEEPTIPVPRINDDSCYRIRPNSQKNRTSKLTAASDSPITSPLQMP